MFSAATLATDLIPFPTREPGGVYRGLNHEILPLRTETIDKKKAIWLLFDNRKPSVTKWNSNRIPASIGYPLVSVADTDDLPKSIGFRFAFLLISDGYLVSSAA
jgi:hypothetical protein